MTPREEWRHAVEHVSIIGTPAPFRMAFVVPDQDPTDEQLYVLVRDVVEPLALASLGGRGIAPRGGHWVFAPVETRPEHGGLHTWRDLVNDDVAHRIDADLLEHPGHAVLVIAAYDPADIVRAP